MASSKESLKKEAEILDLVEEAYENHYLMRHPRVISSIPDAIGVSFRDQMELTGFEVKTSRVDWKTELRTNKNSDSIDVCDYWYIVALEGVVDLREDGAPGAWGLYVVSGGRLRQVREAGRLTPSHFISRELSARILSHILKDLPKEEATKRGLNEGYAAGFRDGTTLPAFFKMTPEKMNLIIQAIENRAHIRAISEMETIANSLLTAHARVKRALDGLEVPKDWETGGEFSAKAIEYGNQIRRQFRSDPKLANMSDEQIEIAVINHMWTIDGRSKRSMY